MKVFCSLILCLALLVSGFAFAEQPVAKCVSIDNAVVKLDGESYELPLALVYGMQLDPATGETLIDFRVDYQDEALFPFQIRFASDALSLLIGKSKTAYTFDAALLEGSDLSYETFVEYFRTLGDLLSNCSVPFPSAEQSAAATEILNRSFSAQDEDATYENQPAKRRCGTLDTDQLFTLADELLNVYSPGMSSIVAGYIDMLNADLATTGEEATAERADSLAALAKKANIALTCDYDRIDTESGAGKLDLTFRLATPDSHEKELVFPIEILFTGPNSGTIQSAFTVEECDGKDYVTLSGAFDATGWNYALAMTDEEGSTLSANMDSHQVEADLVQINSAFAFNLLSDEPISMSYTLDGTIDAACNADYRFSLAVNAEPATFTIDFHESVQDGAVEDRISGAKEMRFSSEDDMLNSSAFIMRLMSLAGDAETLMNDDVLSALISAVNEKTIACYNDLTTASDSTPTREDMPFVIPKFKHLPEGFELIGEHYYTYPLHGSEGAGRSMLRYDLPTEKAADGEDISDYSFLYSPSGIRIDIEGPAGESTQYSLDADGKVVEAERPTIESPEISVLSDNYYKIEFVHESIDYSIMVYENVLPLEDVPTFLAGIVWPEATNP